ALAEPRLARELLERRCRTRAALPLVGLGPPGRGPPLAAGEACDRRARLERAVDDELHDLPDSPPLVEPRQAGREQLHRWPAVERDDDAGRLLGVELADEEDVFAPRTR